jgi:alpha,alpha-trehalase
METSLVVAITKNAVEYNGTIPEKFDLEISSHKVFAEYGNVGTEFDYIAKKVLVG